MPKEGSDEDGIRGDALQLFVHTALQLFSCFQR